MQILQIEKYSNQGRAPSNALSLEWLESTARAFEPYCSPFDPVEPDYRFYLLKRALPRVIQGELTETQRRYLMAHYFDGLSVREIARSMGVSDSTVSKSLSAAEDRLRTVLGYLFAS